MQDLTIFAFDPGRSSVKCAGGEKLISFPSIHGVVDPGQLKLGLGKTPNTFLVKIDDGPLLGIGNSIDYVPAENRLEAGESDIDFLKYCRNYILGMIGKMLTDNGNNTDIMLGITHTKTNENLTREHLIPFLKGRHKVTIYSSKGYIAEEKEFSVHNIIIRLQGWCAMVDYMTDEHCRLKDQTLNDMVILSLDGGNKSTDILVSKGFKVSVNECIDYGMYKVWEKIQAKLRNEQVNLDTKTIEYHFLNNLPVAFPDGTDRGIREFGENEFALMEEKLGNEIQKFASRSNPNIILLSGGMALVFGEKLKQHFPRIRVLENPVMGNVRGLKKFMKRGNS